MEPSSLVLASAFLDEDLYVIPPPFTVWINKSWGETSDAERDLLAGILRSIGQSIDGVEIVAGTPPAGAIASFAQAIGFGVDLPDAARYERVERSGSVWALADSLDTLLADRALKKKLWDVLKRAFIKN